MKDSYFQDNIELDKLFFQNSINNFEIVDLPDFNLSVEDISLNRNKDILSIPQSNLYLNNIVLDNYINPPDLSASIPEIDSLTLPEIPILREENIMNASSFSFPSLQSSSNDEWDSFNEVNDPESGKSVPNEVHANDEWDSFNEVNDPESGKSVPNEVHANDEWDSFNEVNDPESGKSVPNEVHANDEWDSFNEVNDPESGKSVPNEVHANDEWNSFNEVNDPESGKSVPNELHSSKKILVLSKTIPITFT